MFVRNPAWLLIVFIAVFGVGNALTTAAPPGGRAPAVLRLSNGDFVAGELLDCAGADTMRWQGTVFADAFDFSRRAVSTIRFPALGQRPAPTGDYGFELAGGDLLFGSLASISAEEVAVDVPRFGRVHVRRAGICRMFRWHDGADLVYVGPNGMSEWSSSGPASQWTEEGGQLSTGHAGASLTSSFNVPVRSCIELEISWSAAADFTFALGGSGASPLDAFRIEVWKGNLVVYRETDSDADLACLGDVETGSGHAHIQMYLDQEQGRAFVFSVAGQPLAELSVAGGQSALPHRVHLTNKRGDLRLERLRIGRWSGEPPRAVQADRSRIHLADGSIVYGHVTAYDPAAGQFTVDGDGGQRRMSEAEIGSIVSATPVDPQARQFRAVLRDGTRLSGTFAGVEGGRVGLACPSVKEPLHVATAELDALFVLDCEAPASSTDHRVGRLEVEGIRLTGSLVDGERAPGAGCLLWHPVGSATASPLRGDASGKIVYRESRLPAAASPSATRPRPAGGFLGQLAHALAEASAPSVSYQPTSRFGPALFLRTGDTIPCNVERIDERGVTFESSLFDATFVPHEKIRAVELENPSQGVMINRQKRDRLLTLPRMQKNNPPTHLIRSTAGDYLRARLNEMDEENLDVEVRLETRILPRRCISQIIWLHEDELERSPASGDSAASTTDGRIQALRDDGIRLTFVSEQVTDSTLYGVSDVLGPCRVALSDVDQLLIGAAVEQAAPNLAYQRWRLFPAIEPKFVDHSGESTPRSPGTESVLVGEPAPDFELELLDGQKFRLSEHRGAVVVLDFWATWCGPCMQTMPHVDRVVGAFREQNVILIAVNMQEAADAVDAAMERLNLDTAVALDRDGVVAARYAVTAIPQTVIINRQGNIARLFVGGGPQVSDYLQAALETIVTDDDQGQLGEGVQ